MVRGSPPDAPLRVVMVAETSDAMGTRERWQQRDRIDSTLRGLPASARVTLLAADWTTAVIADAAAPDDARRALDRLDLRPSAGRLDLPHALDEAVARAEQLHARLVVWLGLARDGFRRDASARPLARLQGARVALLLAGAAASERALADVAVVSGGGAVEPEALADELAHARWQSAPPTPAAIETISGWLPLETVTREMRWIARLPAAAPGAAAVGSPQDLGALAARARLDPKGPAGAVDAEAQPVLGPFVSALVLESEGDYARFGLPVPAPLETRGRRDAALGAATGAAGELNEIFGRDSALGDGALGADAVGILGGLVGEAYAIGSLGLVGTGAGGGGTGEGVIGAQNTALLQDLGALGGRRARAPDVIPVQPTVHGALDREIVRRALRRHMNELKLCYEQGLAREPALGGRIVLWFAIGSGGQVLNSSVESSTLHDGGVERCAVQAALRWSFPTPLDGNVVTVSFPFVLQPVALAPPAPAPQPRAAPGPWTAALAAMRSDQPLRARAASVAHLLGDSAPSQPVALGWWVAWRARREPGAQLEERLVAAELLRAAGSDEDGRRILSEHVGAPTDVVATLERWGAKAEAARFAQAR
jgi:hypothetical protein